MGDTPFERGSGEWRPWGQHAVAAGSSFAASATWGAVDVGGGNAYLTQRKEQIYGVFADEVEDEVEEEHAVRRSGRKANNERLLLLSASGGSSEDDTAKSSEGDGSSENSGGDSISEGCTTRGKSSRSGRSKISKRYGRRIKFVGGGVWNPETAQQQERKRKRGEQQAAGSSPLFTADAGGGGRRAAAPALSSVGAAGQAEAGPAEKQNKRAVAAASAGVLEEEGDEDETEANEAGCMSLRERILNAQVLKEVLGEDYYDLSSEGEDVKEAAVSETQPQEQTAAAVVENKSGSRVKAEGSREEESKAEAAATVGAEVRKAISKRASAAAGAAAAQSSSSSSSESEEEDTEESQGGKVNEERKMRQRSFRFASNAAGEGGTQQRREPHTSQEGAGAPGGAGGAAKGKGRAAKPAKERNTWGFAKMEKTYGVGFKLLKKMGFTGGGLGRHGTGVANPLEVRIREKNKGLQDSGEKVERKKGAVARGKQLTALDVLLGARRKEKSAGGPGEGENFAEAWRKPSRGEKSSSGDLASAAGSLSAAERRRRRLGGRSPAEITALRVKDLRRPPSRSTSKTANAVRRQVPAVRIIDMTGPEARLIEDESELQQTLQQQKQRAAAAGARRGRKGGDRERAKADRGEEGRGDDGERSDGALFSDEEPADAAAGAEDEEENAEKARLRNLPFKALRQQLETMVRGVEDQLELIARDKKVGEQLLLESVEYVPVTGAASASPSGLFVSGLHCKESTTIVATTAAEIGRSTAAATGSETGSKPAQETGDLPAVNPVASTGEGGHATAASAALLYEEEVSAAVRDACVVADKAAALLQRVQTLYEQVMRSDRPEAAAAGKQGKRIANSQQHNDSMKAEARGRKSTHHRRPALLNTGRIAAYGGEEPAADDRWSRSEASSGSRSPSLDDVASIGGIQKRSAAAGASFGELRSSEDISAAVGERGDDASGDGAAGSSSPSSNSTSNPSCCSVDLDALLVAAEEWRSFARFEFRLLQVPAVLAALAGLVLERRLRGWAPLQAALGASAAAATELAAVDERESAAIAVKKFPLPAEDRLQGAADRVTASSVARLLAFLVSLQQHEEAETRVFLCAVTAAEAKMRGAAANSSSCWATGLLLAGATGSGAGGRGEVTTARGAAVAKCLEKWQEDEVTKIEDEAFGARIRGAGGAGAGEGGGVAGSRRTRRMRSTLGLFSLRLHGSSGTLRLLQLPMRECAEPYRLAFEILEKVLQLAIVEPLRAAVINEWQPEKEGEGELFSAYASSPGGVVLTASTAAAAPATSGGAGDFPTCCRCLSVAEKWFAALPASCGRQLMEEAVVPKLLQAVSAWDPSKARVPVHTWLQPWLPYLSPEDLQLLSLPLQAKIAAALDQGWHPSDRSAVGLLLPWKNVFDAYSFAALLQRSVMPKLHDYLLSMPVRPDHQRLEPLHDVLAWLPLLPVEMLVNLFLTAFFPRWLQVLRVWLGTPQVDLSEVLEWYEGWKQILPGTLLAHPRVHSGVLIEALQLMNFASATVGMQAGSASAAARMSPHISQAAPPGLSAVSALPHINLVHAGAGMAAGTTVDPGVAAVASTSPAYMLHRGQNIGSGSPYPAPPPTAAPPPPPIGGATGGHIGIGAAYDFPTSAAAGRHVGSGVDVGSGGETCVVEPVEPEQSVSLLDYLEGLAKEKNILFKPKPGRVEDGKQVYAYGRMNMYVKEKLIYVKGKAVYEWTAVDVDELLKLAKGEWTKLGGSA